MNDLPVNDAEPIPSRSVGPTERVVRAFFDRDSGIALDEIVSPAAVFVSMMGPGRRYQGPAGVRQYWADAEAGGWEVAPFIDEIRCDEDRALVLGSLHVRRRGTHHIHKLVWGCRIAGGMVASGQAFLDHRAAEAWLTDN